MASASTLVPPDYEERVYAGVLGKVIAVYLGRPFEGWRYDRIMRDLGEITGYVNDRTDLPLKNHLLVVTDDDISGTLVFPRVLDDVPVSEPLDPRAVGRTWLNEIVADRTVLWWGGLGNSTEHTAYLRMRAGVQPPVSGSAALNGTVVAEQVGAQIFCEGFAMTCPGDPAGAADLVQRAASVSHDGEALQAARMVGGMVAAAFVAADIEEVLDQGYVQVDPGSLIAQVIRDVRSWAKDDDWHRTRARIEEHYGYDRYGGNCHVVPNHAVVVAAIAHSGGDFARAMTVVNTSGWDTDSNAGDVGSVMGVYAGLTGLTSGPDFRGPVADRMYLPTANAGDVVTDAAREALRLAAHGRRRRGSEPVVPKDGARYHFTFPGSVQGFQSWDEHGPVEGGDRVTQVPGADGAGRLQVTAPASSRTVALTPTFIPPEAREMPIYGLVASPTLYPGQRVEAVVEVPDGSPGAATLALVARAYEGASVAGEPDELREVVGPTVELAPGGRTTLEWVVPDLDGQPVTAVGLAVEAGATAASTVLLDRLGWSGEPVLSLGRPASGGSMWRRAWVDAVDRFDDRWPEPYRIVQNRGFGQLIQGSRDWRDYRVSADVTPHLAAGAGIGARVQGIERGYLLELTDRRSVRLVRRYDGEVELSSSNHRWDYGSTYELVLEVEGNHVRGWVDGRLVADVVDHDTRLSDGAVSLTIREGRTATQRVELGPCSNQFTRSHSSATRR